jgi:hypothetical protein
MGGAMADTERKDSGSAGVQVALESGTAIVGEVVGPEVGPAASRKAPKPWAEVVDDAVNNGFASIVEAILVNIRDFKHLPSAKLLVDLGTLLKKNGGVQPEEMQSFAELLIKSLEADMAAEAAIGTPVVETGQ